MVIGATIHLSASPQLAACFHLLLLKGVTLTATAGTSLRIFIIDSLGIAADYLETQVQTILYDGRAVDDLDEAVIHDGAVLALSAAMPGLAGAVLRSKGILRGLRREISLVAPAPAVAGSPVSVTVKLFNAVLHDVAPALLGRGVTVYGKDLLERLFDSRKELLESGARLSIDGRPADLAAVERAPWAREPVCFKFTGSPPMVAHIEVKMYASLKCVEPPEADRYPIAPGTTVADLQKVLGIDTVRVKLIFVNGVRSEPGRVLNDGDRVGLFPAVGGG
jgi:molybdopterin converting factor small subunit